MKKIRYYFTLEELTNWIQESEEESEDYSFVEAYFEFLDWHAPDNHIARNLMIDFYDSDYGAATSWLKNTSSKLLERIYFEHSDDSIVAIDINARFLSPEDVDEDSLLTEQEVVNGLRKINNVYLNTYKRYTTLLKTYEDESNNLIADLQKHRKLTFNDTPQNGGNYDDDSHISTVSNESENIPEGIVIERLGKLDELYKDTMNDWLREFDRCFMYEGENDYE